MAGHRRRRDDRFLRWFRVIPLLVLALTLAVSGIISGVPATVTRSVLFPVDHVSAIEASASRHGVDPILVCAVIKCESDWDEAAVSSAGAVGLMQVMPATAESLVDMGLVDPSFDPAALSDPDTNIEFGCAYLGFLQRNLSSLDEIIAAYNAGLAAVQGWVADGGTLPEGIEYGETRVYLERVRVAYDGYKESYPEGISS